MLEESCKVERADCGPEVSATGELFPKVDSMLCALGRGRPPSGEGCRTRVEIGSSGFDPVLCGLGSDPSGSILSSYLRVPSLATSTITSRYLFQLATMPLPAKGKLWLTRLWQALYIGLDTTAGVPPVYPLVKLVGRKGSGNPAFRFSDGGVSWHVTVTRVRPEVPWAVQNVLSSESFAWRWSDTPACLFETAAFAPANLNSNGTPDNYVALSNYSAPYLGIPPGEPVSDLGVWNDVRYPVDDPSKQALSPICLEGPGWLVFWASVWQTNPASRSVITVPAGVPLDPQVPEDALVAAWTQAVYWGVAGGFTVER